MQLGNAYTSMDREYHEPVQNFGPEISKIGTSVAMGIAAGDVRGINSQIMAGAGNLEITFSGMGKGSNQQQTPGLYGKEEREAIRQLAELNKVGLTTHASFNINGLSGFSKEGFSDQHREFVVKELNQAIDFAADTARGGSVTVHTGEFPRAIATQKWAKNKDGYLFQEFKGEADKAVEHLVDKETGRIINSIKRDTEVVVPKYEKKNGKYLDMYGNELKDDDIMSRVPVMKPDGTFDTETKKWVDFEEQARRYNEGKPEDKWRTPQEVVYQEQLNAQEVQMKGLSMHYSHGYKEAKESLQRLNNRLKELEYAENQASPEELEKIRHSIQREHNIPEIAPFYERKLPSEMVKEVIRQKESQLKDMNQTAVSYQVQANEVERVKERVTSMDKYALDKSFQSYAEAGIHAMQRSKGLDKPVFISVEQVFPESYGGHPEELKEVILNSRKKMAEDLEKQGYNHREAENLAETHIKGTFDTAHLNTWWKYYKQDDKLSYEDNKKNFDKWMLNQVEELAKSNVIGNIHISDNFGYEDDHLNPGMGNTPWKDMIKKFEEHGYKGKFIVEPGKEGVASALTQTWAELGSPVFSAYRPGATVDTWTDISHSYFGRTSPANYLVGESVPSQEWTLWSGVPFE